MNANGRPALASIGRSHLLASITTLLAILLFMVLTSRVVSSSSTAGAKGVDANVLGGMFLAVALVLLSWQRARALRAALLQAQHEAHESATTDYLTGLLNRREFARLLNDRSSCALTLGLLDLDRFKMLNDVHGHLAGDEMLKQVGSLLRSAVGDGGQCARLGGDEFAILLPADERAVGTMLDMLQIDLAKLQVSPQQRVAISASIGLTSLHCLSAEEGLRRSDMAMYAAKRAGGGRARWFIAEHEQELLTRADLEHDIRTGIPKGEFVPFFQPQVEVSTGELIGFEVLARWQSPMRGLLLPDSFIEVAEEAGLLGELSMSVMEQALRASKEWPAHLKIAVNIAPSQLKDAMLACRILELLTRTGFPAARLDIELTESSLLHDQLQANALIRSLKNVGVQLSLDDFGTGYASLTQLQSLPFDRIKIDKSFVGGMMGDDQTETIVRTIAGLGRQLKLPVTAEGVESEAAYKLLRAMGCESAQGWLFGKAQCAADICSQFRFSQGAQTPSKAASFQPGKVSREARG
jgi:diguanylate cyclase (GGDEF)-like protein